MELGELAAEKPDAASQKGVDKPQVVPGDDLVSKEIEQTPLEGPET